MDFWEPINFLANDCHRWDSEQLSSLGIATIGSSNTVIEFGTLSRFSTQLMFVNTAFCFSSFEKCCPYTSGQLRRYRYYGPE